MADLHYDAGSTIEMLCRVKRPPAFKVSLRWEVTRAKDNKLFILNHDVTRGGVKVREGIARVSHTVHVGFFILQVDTGRDPESGFLESKLSLARAASTDTGNYTCRLMSFPKDPKDRKGLSDTISVHVLKGENTEAIQSPAAAAMAKLPWTLMSLVISFWAAK